MRALGADIRLGVSQPAVPPEQLPPIDYPDGLAIRRVQTDGRISFKGRPLFVSKAFDGQPVALRPAHNDGVFEILYCNFKVATLDLRDQDLAT